MSETQTLEKGVTMAMPFIRNLARSLEGNVVLHSKVVQLSMMADGTYFEGYLQVHENPEGFWVNFEVFSARTLESNAVSMKLGADQLDELGDMFHEAADIAKQNAEG